VNCAWETSRNHEACFLNSFAPNAASFEHEFRSVGEQIRSRCNHRCPNHGKENPADCGHGQRVQPLNAGARAEASGNVSATIASALMTVGRNPSSAGSSAEHNSPPTLRYLQTNLKNCLRKRKQMPKGDAPRVAILTAAFELH
jgi:hypothetical protein